MKWWERLLNVVTLGLSGKMRKVGQPEIFEIEDSVHRWFELTYAQYVALPRTILQSMPTEWQRRFVAVMEELDEHFDWRRNGCRVKFRTRKGKMMRDEIGDYNRGRRVLSQDEVKALVTEHNRRWEEA